MGMGTRPGEEIVMMKLDGNCMGIINEFRDQFLSHLYTNVSWHGCTSTDISCPLVANQQPARSAIRIREKTSCWSCHHGIPAGWDTVDVH